MKVLTATDLATLATPLGSVLPLPALDKLVLAEKSADPDGVQRLARAGLWEAARPCCSL